MEPFYQIFSEAGPLAAFAAFLAWRSVQEVKRTDAREERFLGTLKDMEEKRDAELEAVRDRWTLVVEKAEAERRAVVEGLESKVDNAVQSIETGLGEMRTHYARVEAERMAKLAAAETKE